MPTSLDDFAPVTRRSTEDVLRAMHPPIAVVGNGPIARPYGEFIDRHATVIRFNNFRLAGYETQVGTKVTHWSLNGVVDLSCRRPPWLLWALKLLPFRRAEGVKPNPHVDVGVHSFCPRAFDWLLVENCRKWLDIDLACVADATLLHPLQAEIPFPTIGFATLYLLLKFQPQASVFGFGGLAGGHYWQPRHRPSTRHAATARRELELIRGTSRLQFYD